MPHGTWRRVTKQELGPFSRNSRVPHLSRMSQEGLAGRPTKREERGPGKEQPTMESRKN